MISVRGSTLVQLDLHSNSFPCDLVYGDSAFGGLGACRFRFGDVEGSV